MRPETRIITSEPNITALIALIRFHLPGPLEVRVSTPKQTRSVKQNRLYWLWVTQMANHCGLLKNDMHEILKYACAVPIFTRDNEQYAAAVMAVKAVRKEGEMIRADKLSGLITHLTSTTNFSVSQMSEYLNDVEHYNAAEIHAALTFPEDLYGSR